MADEKEFEIFSPPQIANARVHIPHSANYFWEMKVQNRIFWHFFPAMRKLKSFQKRVHRLFRDDFCRPNRKRSPYGARNNPPGPPSKSPFLFRVFAQLPKK